MSSQLVAALVDVQLLAAVPRTIHCNQSAHCPTLPAALLQTTGHAGLLGCVPCTAGCFQAALVRPMPALAFPARVASTAQ